MPGTSRPCCNTRPVWSRHSADETAVEPPGIGLRFKAEATELWPDREGSRAGLDTFLYGNEEDAAIGLEFELEGVAATGWRGSGPGRRGFGRSHIPEQAIKLGAKDDGILNLPGKFGFLGFETPDFGLETGPVGF